MYSTTLGVFFFPLALFIQFTVSFNDFPSLMTANATMVVVIEKTFYERKVLAEETSVTTRDAYDKSVANFISAVTKIARERMNISGLSIHAFQDTGVNLAKDYTILLSVASCRTTWDLFRRAQTEKLVHLAINDVDCPRLPIDEGVSIPLVVPGEELPQLFYDMKISEKLKWRRAVIIHDYTIENDTIGKLIQALSHESPDSTNRLVSSSLFSIKQGSSEKITKQQISQLLASLPPRQPTDDHFIIFAGHENIPHVVESARALGMIHPASQWFFVVPDITNISFMIEYLSEGENIAFLYNETHQNLEQDPFCRNGAICHAREMIGALGIALEKALLEEVQLYERVTEEEYDATGIDKLARSRIIMAHTKDELYNDSKAYGGRGSTCGRCIQWIIASAITWGNEIGPVSDNEPHKLKQTAIWTPDPGFEFTDNIFPHVVHGFLGRSLPIATYYNPPWQFIMTKLEASKKLPGAMTTDWDGFIFDILEELAIRLNFTFKIVLVNAPSEILVIKNNPLKASMSASERIPEAVSELVRAKDVFLAACAYTVGMHTKQSGINFTQPITIQTYGLLSPKPKPVSRALLFASPFSNEAWACLASAIIVVGPILYAVHTFSPRRVDYELDHPHSLVLLGLGSPSRCMWYIYGALLQQGGMHLPRTDGARLIVGAWWLVVMVIVATYSGSLVAFLTFPRMEPTVETIDDLLERREEFTWTIPAGSFIEDFLEVGSVEGAIRYKQLLQDYEGSSGKHDSITYDDNIKKVTGGKHVVIDWASSLKISSRLEHLNSGECKFSLGNDVLLLEEPISMAVPSDSPYLRIIDTQIQRMHEAGLMNKWIIRWMPVKDQCSAAGAVNRETDNHKVNLHDMQGIFFVLFFGIMMIIVTIHVVDPDSFYRIFQFIFLIYFIGYIIATAFLAWEFWKHKRKVMKERKLIRPFLD